MKTTREIQAQLKSLGYDPGAIDGIPGRNTIAAIERFQKTMRIPVNGVADALTLKTLFGSNESAADTPWMVIARQKMGLHEVRDNSILRKFLSLGKGTIGDPAQISWCGDFVETCIALALPKEPMVTNPYAAINWLKFGIPTTPRVGALLVFHRGDPNSWQGHIGFYVGEDDKFFHVLGGNQSNSVSITKIAKSRLRPGGVRWPSTYPLSGSAVKASGDGLVVTTNEA